MYETNAPTTNYSGAGWPALWGAVIGGVGGYLVGRNTNGGLGGGNVVYPAAVAAGVAGCHGSTNGCQTCFQEGEYTGENRAGISYIAQQVGVNAQEIRSVNANINARFDAMLQQKIADQAAEIAALRTQGVVQASTCQTNNTLNLIAQQLNGITTGCAVRSVPACPPSACNCN